VYDRLVLMETTHLIAIPLFDKTGRTLSLTESTPQLIAKNLSERIVFARRISVPTLVKIYPLRVMQKLEIGDIEQFIYLFISFLETSLQVRPIGVHLGGILGDERADPAGLVRCEGWVHCMGGLRRGHIAPPQKKS